MEKQKKELDTWTALRSDLNNNYDYSDKWREAVNLFNHRIINKYFNPIQSLIIPKIRQGEGFPIVTIQCALIETFAAFKEGLIYNHNKPDVGGLSYEYKDSRELFVKFLNTEPLFKGIFYNTDKFGKIHNNAPFSGIHFYSQVRCGLMHEARTKGNWHINATLNDNPSDKKFIKHTKKGNVIYRTLFQIALTDYFGKYKAELLNESNLSNSSRRLLQEN
jgi:hypothetical protein